MALGGRQYIMNSIEARNPLYPFTIKISKYEIFNGWNKFEKVEEWLAAYEKDLGLDKSGLWEREYRKFCYLSRTAGPKFLLFLILALTSFFYKTP